jgi:hypothetical protein
MDRRPKRCALIPGEREQSHLPVFSILQSHRHEKLAFLFHNLSHGGRESLFHLPPLSSSLRISRRRIEKCVFNSEDISRGSLLSSFGATALHSGRAARQEMTRLKGRTVQAKLLEAGRPGLNVLIGEAESTPIHRRGHLSDDVLRLA